MSQHLIESPSGIIARFLLRCAAASNLERCKTVTTCGLDVLCYMGCSHAVPQNIDNVTAWEMRMIFYNVILVYSVKKRNTTLRCIFWNR